MIGTPNGYFSTSNSYFHSQENTSNESGIENQTHRNSVPGSPIEDRKYFPNIASSMTNRKSYKNYDWSAYNGPSEYSTSYDNNENITNAPLNLSLNANDSLEPEVIKHATPQLLSLPNSNSVTQLVLTSGQMVQGIQGAQLFVPTSQGLARQIVLTIPITHVTLDQVINLSLANGQIIPTTVGELLKLAMPKSVFDDDVTGEKLINELVKLTETSSVCLAECLKNTLKRNQERKSDMESENGSEKEVDDDKLEIRDGDTSGHTAAKLIVNGSGRKLKESNLKPSNNPLKFTSYSKRKYTETRENGPHSKYKSKRNNESNIYANETRPPRTNGHHQRLPIDLPLSLANEKIDKLTLPSTPPVTREEPTSTMNYDTETSTDFKHDRISPTDSYEDNDLDDIKEFAKSFKLRRLSMGLTQTQVGQALNIAEGPAYSQSAICSALASHVYAAQIASQQHSIFEKLDITPKSAQKIKPVLERWMKEAEERYRNGQGMLTEFIGMESSKKRKRRTSFTPQALEILNNHFEHNTHPSGTEITALAHQLGYDREVIRIWFCNKRQALKNTVRMMSKHMI